jgi:hypothetical protein
MSHTWWAEKPRRRCLRAQVDAPFARIDLPERFGTRAPTKRAETKNHPWPSGHTIP